MPFTLVEKLAARHAVDASHEVRSGDFITIRPEHLLTHDNTAAVIPKFREIMRLAGRDRPQDQRVANPRQPVFVIDHDIQNHSSANLAKYAKIDAFANEQGIDHFPAGEGIGHQVMIERGYVRPGRMVVASDSHANTYGALCCLGTPVVRTDAACIWATGSTWWQVPPVARVVFRGRLRPGVVGKDVIIALCGLFRDDQVLNHAVEFVDGPEGGLEAISIEQRMSMANMTTEWGALVGIFPFDRTLRTWLLEAADRGVTSCTRAEVERLWALRDELRADPEASYAVELSIDLSTVTPHVCGPNDVRTMTAVDRIAPGSIPIQKAWLMSCVNARHEDLVQAAKVLAGRKVAPGVEFFLAPASAKVRERAVADGTWATLLASGAIELPAGCGTCIGLGRGTILEGETGISATNRNFEGRMGHVAGKVYLGSPAVVAASAAAGYLCGPEPVSTHGGVVGACERAKIPSASARVATIPGFPSGVRGRLIFLDRDNLNTDGIYAGKHTYNESMTPAEMASVIFENYDPEFTRIAAPGDVVVGGLNFGTGSSREQAAVALKHFGIACVIAESFSETYKRNAFNNGFVVFECPSLVAFLRARSSGGERTRVVGDVEIDYASGELRVGEHERFAFRSPSAAAQELVVRGGAERAVSARLASLASGGA
jgi:homoaconitate hydratase